VTFTGSPSGFLARLKQSSKEADACLEAICAGAKLMLWEVMQPFANLSDPQGPQVMQAGLLGAHLHHGCLEHSVILQAADSGKFGGERECFIRRGGHWRHVFAIIQ
jgi:hypothetical protein